ncbi:MAG: DUF5916 domain-containing protein [bacterium]
MKSHVSCQCWLFLLSFVHAAFSADLVRLAHIEGSIEVDGILDEPEWQSIAPLPLVMYQPSYLGTMTESTEIRVAYDENYLYMAARLYTKKASDIRGNSLYRDGYSGDDILAIVLDTFNDNENALWFFTNPLGTRFDAAVADDAGGGRRSMNFNWNTYWDVATSQTDEGWFAEMRIPFTSLRFQDADGKVVMGLITYRFLAAKNERHIYPDIPPNWRLGMAKPSMAQDVVIEGVFSKNPVYITPYALGGLQQVSELNPTETGYHLNRDRTNEFGLDIKYNLTNNLTLDGTLNTDFAQVEADDQRLNLTRFSLFFPEKRQFFQERSGMFEFGFGRANRLFHSRTIGLADSEPVRILGGMRLVGRVSKWDLGLIEMQTANAGSKPAENFGILRVRRQMFNAYSNVGGMVTSRVDRDGSYNIAYGVDGIIRVWGDEYVTLKWAQSFDKSDTSGVDLFRTGRAFVTWQRRLQQGFSYDAAFSWSGKDFNPGVGFERRQDFTFLRNSLQYQWFLGEESRFRRVSIENRSQVFLRNEDRSVESASLNPTFALELKTGTNFRFETRHRYEAVPDTFELVDGVTVPNGAYWFHEFEAQFRASRGLLLRPNATVQFGQFYDGYKFSLKAEPSWTVSSHLELSINYEFNRVRFNDRGQGFDAHIARLRVKTALNNHVTLNAFLQFSNISDLVNINARLRYHFSEGNDLWLVYDEGLNTQRNQLDAPRLPISDKRALLLKYTYTFIR